MTGQHSVAFVDESHLKGPESVGFYLLAAVIVDQGTVDQARTAMRAVAGRDPAWTLTGPHESWGSFPLGGD